MGKIMSNTYIHKQKGKYHSNLKNGIEHEIPIKLNNQFDRHNFERGYFRHERNKLIEKIIDKELKTYFQ